MANDLQKADLWKRFSAWLFDAVLMLTLAVGAGMLLSGWLGFETHSDTLEAEYARYEALYDVSFDISEADYMAMTEEARQNYDAAYQALIEDQQAMYHYNMVINLMLVIVSGGLLAAVLIWEFFLPLLFGNGQTLGKKLFGLGLVRKDGVQLNNLQLFTRTLLGKYTIDTMIPAAVLLMLFWGSLNLTGTLVLLGLLLGQIFCVALSKTNSAIHDLLAGTVVVDITSQHIFRSTEDLIAYQKKVAAERAARQTY